MEQNTPPKDNRKTLKILLNILLGVCVLVLVISVVQLTRTGLEYKRGSDEYRELEEGYTQKEVTEDGEEFIALDYDALKEINPDFIGWLEAPGSYINYPVVYRAGDNDTYLNRTFEGAYNGCGTIFADGRAAGDLTAYHTILYGHNMKNNTMFASVPSYLDSGFLQKNNIVKIYTPAGVYHYRVLGARQTDVNDPVYRLDFASREDFSAWAAALGAPASANNILTLSTCTNVEDDGRYVLHAILVSTSAAGEGPAPTMGGGG